LSNARALVLALLFFLWQQQAEALTAAFLNTNMKGVFSSFKSVSISWSGIQFVGGSFIFESSSTFSFSGAPPQSNIGGGIDSALKTLNYNVLLGQMMALGGGFAGAKTVTFVLIP